MGLTYQLGETQVGVRLVQLLLYVVTLVALYKIDLELVPRSSALEAGITVLVFALNPALLAYLVGVALDYILLPFALLYLLFIIQRRWVPAALAAVAVAFPKETGFLLWGATLPVAFWWALSSDGWRREALRGPSVLFAAAVLYVTYLIVEQRSVLAASAEAPECGAPSLALLLSPNLCSAAIQNYLFNLFVLHFAWLLLIPVAAAAVWLVASRERFRDRLRLAFDNRTVVLVSLFLLAWIWVFTRCPLYNNVKYVLNAMPPWLLLVVALLRAVASRPRVRIPFLLLVATAFAASDVSSIDPLSRRFYGVVETEKLPMLCMGSRIYPPGDCGNDDIIYNLQRYL